MNLVNSAELRRSKPKVMPSVNTIHCLFVLFALYADADQHQFSWGLAFYCMLSSVADKPTRPHQNSPFAAKGHVTYPPLNLIPGSL